MLPVSSAELSKPMAQLAIFSACHYEGSSEQTKRDDVIIASLDVCDPGFKHCD